MEANGKCGCLITSKSVFQNTENDMFIPKTSQPRRPNPAIFRVAQPSCSASGRFQGKAVKKTGWHDHFERAQISHQNSYSTFWSHKHCFFIHVLPTSVCPSPCLVGEIFQDISLLQFEKCPVEPPTSTNKKDPKYHLRIGRSF